MLSLGDIIASILKSTGTSPRWPRSRNGFAVRPPVRPVSRPCRPFTECESRKGGRCHDGKRQDENRYRIESHQGVAWNHRSEEHTSELQSLMRNSYAVFCLKKKKKKQQTQKQSY